MLTLEEFGGESSVVVELQLLDLSWSVVALFVRAIMLLAPSKQAPHIVFLGGLNIKGIALQIEQSILN